MSAFRRTSVSPAKAGYDPIAMSPALYSGAAVVEVLTPRSFTTTTSARSDVDVNHVQANAGVNVKERLRPAGMKVVPNIVFRFGLGKVAIGAPSLDPSIMCKVTRSTNTLDRIAVTNRSTTRFEDNRPHPWVRTEVVTDVVNSFTNGPGTTGFPAAGSDDESHATPASDAASIQATALARTQLIDTPLFIPHLSDESPSTCHPPASVENYCP
jgi:hypothetical protein